MKTPAPYLEDILRSISLIEEYLHVSIDTKEDFLANIQLQDSILRRLEIIGEATKRLQPSFKDQHPEVPWRSMSGLRDVLTHEYDEVDLEQIWKVIIEDLPPLKKDIAQLLENL